VFGTARCLTRTLDREKATKSSILGGLTGLLDEVTKGLTGKIFGQGVQNPLLDTVLNLINNPQTGGLAGMVQGFKDKGLGEVVSSWVGKGENLPVSGEQIQSVIGDDQIAQLAEKAGTSKEQVSGSLAKLFPEIVDKLTPNGTLPEGGLLQRLDSIKQNFLGS